ncbi:MAG: fibronectin type III domain-containing protein [Armatimonadota bacterium]
MPRYLSASADLALHGKWSLVADVPLGVTAESAARQDVPACVGCTYEFSAWVRVLQDRGGEARLVLQMRGADMSVLAQEQVALRGSNPDWTRLAVRLKAPKDTVLVTVGAPDVVGGMKAQYDALRLGIIDGPRTRTPQPLAQRLEAVRTEPTWVLLRWLGPPGTYEVSYRSPRWPRDERATFSGIDTLTYSAVGLGHGTAYDFRVRYVMPQHYNELGQPITAPVVPPPSPDLRITTAPFAARSVAGLRVWPPTHLNTFHGAQTSPRIVTWKDALYVVESHEETVYLSRVRPTDLTIDWTRELITAPTTTGGVLQRVTDASVFADQLFVMTDVEPLGGPITASRQFVYAYDLQQQTLAVDPVAIQPVTSGAGTRQGGLGVFRQQLWALWSEVVDQQGQWPTRLMLAPITNNVLGELHIFQDAPSPFLGSATCNVFGGELLIGFSVFGADRQRPGYEPLSLVRFDGVTFHGLRKVADLGRNSDGRGAEVGSNFYLLHSTDLPWASYGGRFRDLRLTVLQPDGLAMETITYLDDMKYNISSSATAHDNTLYVVHEKLEREPVPGAPPPWSYGTFIGRVEVGQPPAEAAR